MKMLLCYTKSLCIRGKPLEQLYCSLSRASLSWYSCDSASQPVGNVVIGQSAAGASLLCCNGCTTVLSVRTFSLSSSDLKGPGKPSGINKSKSMFRYTRKFLDGGMEEPKLVYNTVTGRPEDTCKKVFVLSGTPSRRLQVLNKLFFDNIRDIMTSGMFADHLIGCNFHVTKVRVLDGMTGIHVHYLQTGSSPEPSPEMLKNVGRLLRRELHNLAITALIPVISFKKDESFENVFEVERRLAIIAQTDELERQQGQLEAVHQPRLTAPQVPDMIFEDDFKYDLSSPLNFSAASAHLPNPKNRPRSSFTPFAPRFSYLREKNPTDPTWNRPERVQFVGAVPSKRPPRQVPLPTNMFNLNRAAVMSKVEQGLGRVQSFKRDGMDINVYEANMVDLCLDTKLLEGDDRRDQQQEQQWEPVLEIMPRPTLQRWATKYTKDRARARTGEGRKAYYSQLTAGERSLNLLRDDDYDDVKFYEIENELRARTEAPDYCEDD